MPDQNKDLPENQDTQMPEQGPETQKSAPILNVPASLLVFVILLLAIHAARTYLFSSALDQRILIEGGFIPVRFHDFLEFGDFGWLATLLTYSLLHGNWQHVFFNCIWMLVFGTPVAIRLGLPRTIVFFVTSSTAAAMGFWAVHPDSVILLIGASGIVSGLTGAACRFAMGNGLSPRNRAEAYLQPRLSIMEALTNRSVLVFIVFWFVTNVAASAGLGFLESGSAPVAWEAHIAGFLFGFLTFSLFDPGPNDKVTLEA